MRIDDILGVKSKKPAQPDDDSIDSILANNRPASSAARRVLGDTGVSLLKGAIAVPEAAVGLADIATGGQAGKLAEQIGFRPKEAKGIAEEWYSPEQKAANQALQEAKGFVPTITTAVQNPSTIAQAIAESVPSIGAGGVVGRGILAAAPRVGAALAGGIGEGAVSAGSTAEQLRQESATGTITPTQAGIAALSGGATTALGFGGAKLANRLGIGDVESMLVKGSTKIEPRTVIKEGVEEAAKKEIKKGLARKAAEGFISEGVFEEMTQSAQEQAALNIAQGKPWDEGVAEASAMGLLTGGIMGSGAAAISHRSASKDKEAPPGITAPAPGERTPYPKIQEETMLPNEGPQRPPPTIPGEPEQTGYPPLFEQPPTGTTEPQAPPRPRTSPPLVYPELDGQQATTSQPLPQLNETPEEADRLAKVVAGLDSRGRAWDLQTAQQNAITAREKGNDLRVVPTETGKFTLLPHKWLSAERQNSYADLQPPAQAKRRPEPAAVLSLPGPDTPIPGQFIAGKDGTLRPATYGDRTSVIEREREASAAAAQRQAAAIESGLTADVQRAAAARAATVQAVNVQTGETVAIDKTAGPISAAAGSAVESGASQTHATPRTILSNPEITLPPPVQTDQAKNAPAGPAAAAQAKEETAYPKARAEALALRMTAQGLDSHAVPHPTKAGMWAIAEGKPDTAQADGQKDRNAESNALPISVFSPKPAATTANRENAAEPSQPETKPAKTETEPAKTDTAAGKIETAKALAARVKALRALGVLNPQIKQAVKEARAGDMTLLADLERINARPAAPAPAAPTAPQTERRKDTEKRKEIEQMTPEEMREELLKLRAKSLIDYLTGLPNKEAYDRSEKQPVQVFIDADSLKWVNDTLGYPSGDEMLKAIAQSLVDENLTAYHPSGDEFLVQGTDAEGIDAAIQRAMERLSRSTIEATKADGTTITLNGLGFSYGTGSTIKDAEQGLKDHKKQREAEGLRAARGEQPAGATFSRRGGQGGQVEGQAAAQEEVAKPEVSPPSESDKKETSTTPAAAPIDPNEVEGMTRIRAMAARLNAINPEITGNGAIKTAKHIARAIDTGVYNDILHPANKASRQLFHEMTGIKLPAGVTATQRVFTGTPFAKTAETAPTTVQDQPAAEEDLSSMFDDVLAEETAKTQPPPATRTKKPATPQVEAPAGSAPLGMSDTSNRASKLTIVPALQAGSYIVREPTEGGRFQNLASFRIGANGKPVQVNHFFQSPQTRSLYEAAIQKFAADRSIRPVARTAGQAAASAAKNTAAGFHDAIKGLGELFGGKGKLSSGLTFDDETYAKAKPLFQQAIANFANAGADIKEVMRAVVRTILDQFGKDATANMKPYVVRFMDDVRKGEVGYADSTTAGGPENAARELDQAGTGALGGKQAQDVRGTEGIGPTGTGVADSGGRDSARDAEPDGTGVPVDRRVGDGAGDVSVPAGRTGSERGTADQPGLFGSGGAESDVGTGGTVGRGNVAPAQFNPSDFTITDEIALGQGGQKTKYRQNIAAIKLLKQLEQDGRHATPEEQKTLAQYVGWGGLSQAFNAEHADWKREFQELKDLLTPDEYAAAEQSTQYAHYTSRPVIDGIYSALARMGFTGGNVLEAGAGVGNFIGLMPSSMRTAGRFTGVERERIAAGIAKHLYPLQNIQQADFTQFGQGEDGVFDAVIGNPPFSSTTLTDLSGRKHLSGLSIHNYFISKSIDMLREGGVLAVVVSNSFMDAKNDRARQYIGQRAKLLGAIRLPNNAFLKNAGTEVTTDIIFLQKLPENLWGSKEAREDAKRWGDPVAVADPQGGAQIPTNAYFQANPQMMLGKWGRFGTMYGPDQAALVAAANQDTGALLQKAVQALPEGVYQNQSAAASKKLDDTLYDSLHDKTVSEYGFYNHDGKLWQRVANVRGEASARAITEDTQWTEKTKLGASGFDRLTRLADMRRTMRDLLAAEVRGDAAMDALRKTLNTQYDAYVSKHGLINEAGTARVFDDDPDYPLLSALELDFNKGITAAVAKSSGVKPVKPSAKKAPIFSQRVIEERKVVTRSETAQDALNVSMAERGRIDAEYIAKLLGTNSRKALEQMTTGENPLLFVDPATDEYVLRDAYLSGNVRKKLEQAKQAGSFENARALEAVIPEDVPAYKIVARVGSPWVPVSVYQDFARHLFGDRTDSTISYIPLNSSFSGSIRAESDVANTNTYGIPAYPGADLLMAILNNKPIRVMTRDADGNPVVNKEQTGEAQLKAADIKDKFNDWLFTDPDRSELLVRSYNDSNNNYVPRKYDGNWLNFPGKVPDSIISFRRHQRNFIARVIQDRTALADHVVGAGKTYAAISAAMELKRTGLAKKSLIAVPNHLVKQWAADFYRLYPGANILTATKNDFKRENRRRFLAKIATGDWDAVIIAHSSFGFIKPDSEFETAFNGKQIAKIVATIKHIEDEDGDKATKKRTVKQLEALKERLEQRIRSLRDKPMDDLLDLGQLGVDQMFVDEAHMFKNLIFTTKMQNIRGLGDGTGSQRAYDMYVKTSQIMEKNGRGQGVVFLTGTPISNTLPEMYHMMRYLMPAQMEELGFESFDAWANTYAEIEPIFMQSPSGVGFKASNRMSKFSNAHELLKLFDQVADTVTMDDIKAAYREENQGKEFPLPALKTGRRQPISLDKSEAQTAFMKDIARRAAIVEARRGPPKKGEDNILTIMMDGRKAAMDIRLVDQSITQREKGGRIDRASSEIFDRYKQYDHVRGTQLVFSDLGTPIKHAKKELAEYTALQDRIQRGTDQDVIDRANLGEEAAGEIIADAEAAQNELDSKGGDWLTAIRAALRGFSIYDDMKAALIERGIPENEIAFIHDFNTDEQKAALFQKMNRGNIRVLLGSTPKLGAGTNVQERLVALHHLDVPWKPSDVEQREGRIIRQGNKLSSEIPGFEVEVLGYVTKDTLDMRMWQVQEAKLKMINQLRTRNIGREIDNAFEDMELSAGEMQAAATGNMDLLHEIKLRTDIQQLERKKRAFDAQKSDLQNRLNKAISTIKESPAIIEKGERLNTLSAQYLKTVSDYQGSFSVTINGKKFTDPREASDLLIDLTSAEVETVGADGEKKKRAAPLNIEMNGVVYTARTKLADAFSELRGDDIPILFDRNGVRMTRSARIVKEIAPDVGETITDQTEREIGQLGPFKVFIESYSGRYGKVIDIRVQAPNGESVATDKIVGENEVLDTISRDVLRAARSLVAGIPRSLDWYKADLAKAQKTLKELEATPAGQAWPQEDALKKMRETHRELVKKMTPEPVAPAQQAAAPDQDAAVGSAEQVPGSKRMDGLLLSMVAQEKPATEILKAIATGSRNPFHRLLATKLQALVADTKVNMGSAEGLKFAVDGIGTSKFAASYSPKKNTVTIHKPRNLERNLLHEFMHAATYRAIRGGGAAAVRMLQLYNHVKADGRMNRLYGMANVDEFVVEAFSNPQFQEALKLLAPPNKGGAFKNAWDSFVNLVRHILGLPVKTHNALSEALSIGARLMAENAAQAPVSAAVMGNLEDIEDLRKRANTVASDFLDTAKSFNWVNRTISTQFHKATKDPLHFGRVFNLSQQFLETISRAASRPADLAPTLLPKLENARAAVTGLFGGPKSQALFSGLAPAVFSDEIHNPASHVWTDAELRAKFKLGDAQINLYREFRAAVDASLDEVGAAEAWSSIRRYVPREQRDVARERVMSAPAGQASAVLHSIIDQAVQAEPSEEIRATIMGQHKQVDGLFKRAAELKAAGYAPRMRFGRFTVTAFELDQDGKRAIDAGGEPKPPRYFGMFESEREANVMARRLRATFGKEPVTVVSGVASEQQFKLYRGISPETVGMFADVLAKNANPEQRDQLRKTYDAWRALSFNNHSTIKRLIERKDVAGFGDDVQRVLASFITSNARRAASAYVADDISESVARIPNEKGDVKDEAIALSESVLNPEGRAPGVRNFLFFQYLGGSLAAAAVNMTQPIAMTLPYLTQHVGVTKATRLLAGAARQMFKVDNAELAAGLRKASEEGIVEPQEIHYLYSQSIRGGLISQIPGGMAHRAQAFLKLWGTPFAIAEKINRRMTFIAAWNAAVDMGEANPFQFAKQAVEETQGIYNAGNANNLSRTALGSVAMTFRQYSIAYMEMLTRMWKSGPEGKKAALVALAILALAAGAGGLPFADDLDDLIDTLGQGFGYDTNAKRWKQNMATEILGETISPLVLYGLSPYLPIDIQGRLGMGNLLPATSIIKKSENAKEAQLLEILGPIGGVAQSYLQGAEAALSGDYFKAARAAIMPKAFKDIAQGADIMATGMYRDTKGRNVTEADMGDAVAKAIGFQPSDVAKVQRRTRIVQQDVALQRKTAGEIADQRAQAIIEKDPEMARRAIEQMKAWNLANPEMPIVITAAQINSRVRNAMLSKEQRVIRSAPATMRPRVFNELQP